MSYASFCFPRWYNPQSLLASSSPLPLHSAATSPSFLPPLSSPSRSHLLPACPPARRSPLDCCVFPPLLFLHIPAGVAAAGGHDVVVAARRVGLCAAGGGHRLLPDHWPALQGVQREEREASGPIRDGQQTERRQAEARWERKHVPQDLNWSRCFWPFSMHP